MIYITKRNANDILKVNVKILFWLNNNISITFEGKITIFEKEKLASGWIYFGQSNMNEEYCL